MQFLAIRVDKNMYGPQIWLIDNCHLVRSLEPHGKQTFSMIKTMQRCRRSKNYFSSARKPLRNCFGSREEFRKVLSSNGTEHWWTDVSQHKHQILFHTLCLSIIPYESVA